MASPADWNKMLENVMTALAHAEGEAARSLGLIDGALGDPSMDSTAPATANLLDGPFRRLETCVAQADLLTGQTEAALHESEQALRQWLALADAIRRKLGSPAADPV